MLRKLGFAAVLSLMTVSTLASQDYDVCKKHCKRSGRDCETVNDRVTCTNLYYNCLDNCDDYDFDNVQEDG
jgi:hypothetical protein